MNKKINVNCTIAKQRILPARNNHSQIRNAYIKEAQVRY